jgi:hypothetical protein
MKIFYLLIFSSLTISIFYFSWLPEPSFKTENYLPNWLIRWTDEYGIVRTGVPFFLLGTNAVLLKIDILNRVTIFLGSCFLLITAEVGQLFIPHRHCDIWDILFGSAAIVVGIFIGEIILKISKRKKIT